MGIIAQVFALAFPSLESLAEMAPYLRALTYARNPLGIYAIVLKTSTEALQLY